VLVGRLTADPEERFSNDGMEISKFRIAVDRRGRGGGGGGGGDRDRDGGGRERAEADFFNVICFRQSAKFANQYLRRGNLVAVEGRLEMDEYTDRDGNRRTWVQVVSDNVQSLQSRAESEGGRGGGGGGGGRWEHDRDFAEDDEPRGGGGGARDRDRGPAPEREAAPSGGGGGGGRRQQFPRPVEDDPFAEDDKGAKPRGGGGGPASARGGAGFEDDEGDPFAEV
jgi:single-strand DNA-binding protein